MANLSLEDQLLNLEKLIKKKKFDDAFKHLLMREQQEQAERQKQPSDKSEWEDVNHYLNNDPT